MAFSSFQSVVIKRYTKVVLAFFVLSILNMSMQIPAHAAMKDQMQQHQMMPEMATAMMSDMSSCYCPPSLCDSVLAFEHQVTDVSTIGALSYLMIPSLIESTVINHQSLNSVQRSYLIFLDIVENSPPPLLIKTLLQV